MLLGVREKNCSAEENRQSPVVLYLDSSMFSRYPTGKGTNKGTVVWLTVLGRDWVQKACEHVPDVAMNAVETETRSWHFLLLMLITAHVMVQVGLRHLSCLFSEKKFLICIFYSSTVCK